MLCKRKKKQSHKKKLFFVRLLASMLSTLNTVGIHTTKPLIFKRTVVKGPTMRSTKKTLKPSMAVDETENKQELYSRYTV